MPSEIVLDESEMEMNVVGVGDDLPALIEARDLPVSTNSVEDGTRLRLMQLHRQGESVAFEFALTLGRVQKESLYRLWGYESFDQYVQNELDVQIRQAQQIALVGNYFGSLPPAYRELAQRLGPTKARLLVGRLDKAEEAEGLVRAITTGGRRGGEMSLQEMKEYLAEGNGRDLSSSEEKGSKKPAFRVPLDNEAQGRAMTAAIASAQANGAVSPGEALAEVARSYTALNGTTSEQIAAALALVAKLSEEQLVAGLRQHGIRALIVLTNGDIGKASGRAYLVQEGDDRGNPRTYEDSEGKPVTDRTPFRASNALLEEASEEASEELPSRQDDEPADEI
jgi:hypothetical protein